MCLQAAFLFGRRFWRASHSSAVPARPHLGRHTSYAGVDRETLVSLTTFEATVRVCVCVCGQPSFLSKFWYLWLFAGLTVVGGWRSAGSHSFGAAAFCCWLGDARLRLRCCSLMGGVLRELPWGAAAAAHFVALFVGNRSLWRASFWSPSSPCWSLSVCGIAWCRRLFHKPASAAVCIDVSLCYGLPLAVLLGIGSGSPLPHPQSQGLRHPTTSLLLLRLGDKTP